VKYVDKDYDAAFINVLTRYAAATGQSRLHRVERFLDAVIAYLTGQGSGPGSSHS
jgi:hypothetical protein